MNANLTQIKENTKNEGVNAFTSDELTTINQAILNQLTQESNLSAKEKLVSINSKIVELTRSKSNLKIN